MIRYGKVTRFVLKQYVRGGVPLGAELSTNECKALQQMWKRYRRPVPVLTPAQEAFHHGITPEAFSLEKAVEMYANRERK
jgi:hypothetical protein